MFSDFLYKLCTKISVYENLHPRFSVTFLRHVFCPDFDAKKAIVKQALLLFMPPEYYSYLSQRSCRRGVFGNI